MADVAGFDVVEFDYIDTYEAPSSGKSYGPPVEGRYTGRLPIFTDDAFKTTQENRRKVIIDPIEVIGTEGFDGNPYRIRFTSASAKPYAKRKGSQVIDLLQAAGVTQLPKSDEELQALVKSISGRTVQFQLIWEAYDKDTQETTSGMENFPPDPQDPTKRLSYVTSSIDSQKKVYANGKVKFFLSQK